MPASFKLLVLAPNAWFGQWVNRQQLFSRVGRRRPVLYGTGTWFSWDRHGVAWRQASWAGGHLASDNVLVDQPPRWLLRLPRLPWLDAAAVRLQCWRWKRLLRRRGPGPLVAYVYHPQFLPYALALKADYLVYHAYDLYAHTPGWDQAQARAELLLLQRADLVIASSEQIAVAQRALVAREVRVLPNGADVAAFAQALDGAEPEPDDLRAIPHPRLGWVGSLHPQVDYGLIAELAARRPDWHFVLVGHLATQADARADAERAECGRRPNVHFLGAKPVTQVPRYLAGMDVNLMIYRLASDSWILSGYPLKLHEYLAVGRPVVSADLPSVRPFAPVVRIAHGADDWQEAIGLALAGAGNGTPAQRRQVAAENSWEQRAATLDAWLLGLAPGAAPD